MLLLIAIAVIAPGAVSAAGTIGPDRVPAVSAAEESAPRLSIVAPVVTFPITFGTVTPDGTHVFFRSVTDPATDANDSFSVWDALAQRYVRVSYGHFQNASTDGQAVVVRTELKLTSADLDDRLDIYLVKDGETRLVSLGTSDGADGGVPFISDDGEVVVFRTNEGVDPADTDRDWDFYAWNGTTDTVTWISDTTTDLTFRYGTPNGSRFFFTDTLFRTWERAGGPVAVRATGPLRQISANGDRLYFSTTEPLVPEDTDLLEDGYVHSSSGFTLMTPGTTTHSVVYRADESGKRWLIGTADRLAPSDTDDTDDAYLISAGGVLAGPWEGIPFGYSADLSVVISRTPQPLAPEDVDGWDDFYRFRVSDSTPALITSPTWPDRTTLRAVSPDGRRIILDTAEPLISETLDGDGRRDVYEWFDGSMTLLSPGSPREANYLGASADARRVVFEAFDPLVAEDLDTTRDVYISDRDIDPPIATIQGPPNGHSASSATIRFGSVDDDAVWFDCRLDGGTWSECEATSTFTGLPPGEHTVEVHAFDAAANRSAAPAIASWIVDEPPPPDTTPPTTNAPTHRLVNGSGISAGRTTIRLGWTGSDATSGIARYELAQSTDGLAWATVSTSLTGTSLDRLLATGHTYRFRVRAVDRAGNTGVWTYGSTFRLTGYSESSSRVRYSGTWSLSTSSVYWGGKARASSRAGAKASLTFTGRSVEFVSRRGPTRGKAQIYVNGVLKATVDLYASSYQNQRVVWTASWSSSATRTITVGIAGTSGRPRVDLDAFVVVS